VEQILNKLCDVLSDELERQETVLAICMKKHEAIKAMDRAALEARTEALENVVKETMNAEMDRHRVLREVVKAVGLPNEKHTLSELINAVENPWKDRLAHMQHCLKSTIEDTQRVTRAYSRDLRRYRQLAARQMVNLGIVPDEVKIGAYTQSGCNVQGKGAISAVMNQRG